MDGFCRIASLCGPQLHPGGRVQHRWLWFVHSLAIGSKQRRKKWSNRQCPDVHRGAIRCTMALFSISSSATIKAPILIGWKVASKTDVNKYIQIHTNSYPQPLLFLYMFVNSSSQPNDCSLFNHTMCLSKPSHGSMKGTPPGESWFEVDKMLPQPRQRWQTGNPF